MGTGRSVYRNSTTAAMTRSSTALTGSKCLPSASPFDSRLISGIKGMLSWTNSQTTALMRALFLSPTLCSTSFLWSPLVFFSSTSHCSTHPYPPTCSTCPMARVSHRTSPRWARHRCPHCTCPRSSLLKASRGSSRRSLVSAGPTS